MISQTLRILNYMQGGGTITDEEARQLFRCNRLSARILDIKNRGYIVLDRWECHRNENGEFKRWKRYWIVKKIGEA